MLKNRGSPNNWVITQRNRAVYLFNVYLSIDDSKIINKKQKSKKIKIPSSAPLPIILWIIFNYQEVILSQEKFYSNHKSESRHSWTWDFPLHF